MSFFANPPPQATLAWLPRGRVPQLSWFPGLFPSPYFPSSLSFYSSSLTVQCHVQTLRSIQVSFIVTLFHFRTLRSRSQNPGLLPVGGVFLRSRTPFLFS